MGLNGGGIPIIAATATGNPLSFITDMVRPLKSLEIPFTPIQSGSGNPSPTNVRPISGWTGAIIEQRGKNLLDSSDYSDIRELRYSDGTFTETGTDGGPYANIYFCRTYKNGTRIGNYSLIDDGAGRKACNITVNVGDIDTIQIGFLTFNNNAYVNFKASDVIVESGTYNISYNVVTVPTFGTLGAFNDVQISKTDSSYEPYHGITIPIAFTDPTTGDPLTVYGGTLTLNEDGSADLVHEYGMKPISDWKYYTIRTQNPDSGWDSFQLYLPYGDIKRAGSSVVDGKPNIWSTIFQARTNAEIADNPGYSIRKSDVYIYFAVPADTYTSWNDFKTAFGDIPIVYPLATPQTYHFDNVGQLITFVGTNNIWTDTNGTNTATYLKHQS